MNRLMFKKIFSLMYNSLTLNGWDEKRMYGNDLSFRIETMCNHYFSFWIIGCRGCFIDSTTKESKSFGKTDELDNVEVVYNDEDKIEKYKATVEDPYVFNSDFQTSIEDFYKVLDSVQIDWISVIQGWLNGNTLVSDSFERNCTIQHGKVFRAKLEELITY